MSDAPNGHDDLLLIGTIGVPFGTRGQVKLHALTSHPEQLQRIKTLFVGDDHAPIGLRRAFQHKPNVLILTLDGFESRSAVDALRGADVFIPENEAAPLEEDEYFLHDLPGLRVETGGGEVVGIVNEVIETGANDVLVVDRPEGGQVLIPMIHAVVKSLDIPAGRLVIEPMEGLLR